MPRRWSRDLSVGVLFSLALIIAALGLMAVGGESRFFVDKSAFHVVFPNADGLVVGSPVKMSGLQIGTVSRIELSPDPDRTGIDVTIGVDQAFAGRVRADSRAALRILQILSGEKFVEITPGSSGQPVLPQGALIEPSQDPEILQQAAVAAENLNDITLSLKAVLGALERGEGLMGQMINDPEFGRAGLEALRGTAENLELLTGDLVRSRTGGPGFLSRLLYDPEFAGKVDVLGRSIDDLARTLEALDLRGGAVGALLEDDGSGERMVEDLGAAAASLRAVAARLERPEGLLGRLLNDSAYSERLAADLERTLSNLAEITDKVNRGEGTLGALLNERELHDSLENLATGAEDSKFTRWLTRYYRKKGVRLDTAERLREQEEAASDAPPGGGDGE